MNSKSAEKRTSPTWESKAGNPISFVTNGWNGIKCTERQIHYTSTIDTTSLFHLCTPDKNKILKTNQRLLTLKELKVTPSSTPERHFSIQIHGDSPFTVDEKPMVRVLWYA